jgi:hypothetical protein
MMIPEVTLIKHSDYVEFILRILLHDVIQIHSLFMSKFVVHLSIPGYFDCELPLLRMFVVSTFNYLSKWSFSEDFNYFIPVSQMFSNIYIIITLKVVKDRITLVLPILRVLLLSFPASKFRLPLCIFGYEFRQRSLSSCSYTSSKIHGVELFLTWTKFSNFFRE